MLEIGRDELYAEIGRRVRQARQRQTPKMNQSDLATRLKIERTSISNIEKGLQRATIHFLFRLARELRLNLQDLLPDLYDPKIEAQSVTQVVVISNLDKKKTRTVPPAIKSVYDRF